ncbi:unnamed protein product [Symbiodinium natans]|uniref:Uncharacterized protein n=1 Tax=Symbiodinium natans TaxID=878477 RepID=A0A812TP91_9DINO|nr:unnamed protein product [Symbiodinium natans]
MFGAWLPCPGAFEALPLQRSLAFKGSKKAPCAPWSVLDVSRRACRSAAAEDLIKSNELAWGETVGQVLACLAKLTDTCCLPGQRPSCSTKASLPRFMQCFWCTSSMRSWHHKDSNRRFQMPFSLHHLTVHSPLYLC